MLTVDVTIDYFVIQSFITKTITNNAMTVTVNGNLTNAGNLILQQVV